MYFRKALTIFFLRREQFFAQNLIFLTQKENSKGLRLERKYITPKCST